MWDGQGLTIMTDAPTATPRPFSSQRRRRVARTLLASGILCAGAASMFPGLGWLPGMIAEIAAQALLVSLPFAVVWAVRRRWACAAASSVACVLLASALLQPRAPFTPGSGEKTIRVLALNGGPENEHPDELLKLLTFVKAEVVALVEPNPGLVRGIRRHGALDASFPHGAARGPVSHLTSWRLVLSEFPVLDTDENRTVKDLLSVVVRHPSGEFGMVVVHPSSPRSPSRWREGNELIDRALSEARRLESQGYPTLIIGDLNSTPTGHRSRLLARGGYLRCKPLRAPIGTFPAWSVWPAMAAIDDACASPGWRVRSWRTIRGGGSDHRGVLIELVIPPRPAPR
ncbi:MAG: endonuclease/exonuclease/phosphatase family protein [Leptolyngbya sp. PLA2]|nr:endonuclease/exonuclease/phosphatase family protein [Leptolyngbya sp.]MCE7971803.1 endonuclease/exonuclease/phosphatase family protein [Leptolyngbya sp. PL-A2]GIK19760.1 MAG: hypothetical protein BroJett004_19240 [Planctomycetota bacterium]